MMSYAKESSEFDASGDAKNSQSMLEVDEDETILADDAKKPPMRASVGWSSDKTFASEEKTGGEASDLDAIVGNGSTQSETKRGGRRRKVKEGEALNREKRNRKNRYFDEDDETTDIIEIPDLEEEEREPDITTMIADAPRNTTRTVQSLKQLEKDIKFALPSAQTFGVDLHLLTNALCPERAVFEDDDLWDFDTLLNDIAQEMQKDLDEKEEITRLGTVS